MPGFEDHPLAPQETELSSAVYIIDEITHARGIPEREVFVVRIPFGMDLERERAEYKQRGGQVRTFGQTVDTGMISYQRWLVSRGAEIQDHPDLTQIT